MSEVCFYDLKSSNPVQTFQVEKLVFVDDVFVLFMKYEENLYGIVDGLQGFVFWRQ